MADDHSGASSRLYPETLRGAIDSGRTGDKVNFPDPAAAPLGTDDEAAGFPASASATQRAMDSEMPPPASPPVATSIEDWELSGAPAMGLAIALMLALLMALYYFASHMR
ncbi:MAG: hypothetical protein K2Y29_15465 [Beijerinckiaceae bacterium]|nr:hypothetical protein [Beijerinckiaceae bacterium]